MLGKAGGRGDGRSGDARLIAALRAAARPRSPAPRARSRRRRAERAAATPPQLQLVVRRAVRQVRPRRAAARPQGLQGSLLDLSQPVAVRVPQSRRSRRSRLFRAQAPAIAAEYKIKDGPTTRARCSSARPARRSFPAAVPQRAGRARAPTAARRPICRCSPRRAPIERGFPGSSSTSSPSTRSRGPTTSSRS